MVNTCSRQETENNLKKKEALVTALKPREVVDQLDKFIVGQQDAKKAVAIALRNRWRRHQMSDELKSEVITLTYESPTISFQSQLSINAISQLYLSSQLQQTEMLYPAS